MFPDEQETPYQSHVTFRSLPIRFHDAIKDVDIKFGKQQKPLMGNSKVYKRDHPLSPTGRKGPSLLPRDGTTDEDFTITTEEITVSDEFLSQGLDPQLSDVTTDFVSEDEAAYAANGFGFFPGADDSPSLLSPDVIDPNAVNSETYVASTIIPTNTGRVDDGVPTPTTTPAAFDQADGSVTLSSYNATDPFIIVALSNGNLVRRDETAALNAGETKTFTVQGGFVMSDDGERMFNLYQNEIQSFGVSRVRLHKEELVPKTALFV
ncbi:hypothetical protein ABW20_dc0108537 [Dactylellina cionopaga]|nr:hypothetical protein ABW20_dc0108537 [Dactylellina cionopaga]